ncbi:hypothetical protein AAFF_G00019240 [Aldrovandia affinis]|uniref:Uncharacterized protein n=1 Tax=Aldrovandia affinis TaxID=143900 RepID=A0AAD7S5G0_9TELE|nr:hypothetical protein AAFF_G00019240 [Aldrovandia affinis]
MKYDTQENRNALQYDVHQTGQVYTSEKGKSATKASAKDITQADSNRYCARWRLRACSLSPMHIRPIQTSVCPEIVFPEGRGSDTQSGRDPKKGDRGVLVKQEVLRHRKRTLSLTLPSLHRDQLHWTCVVFTESMLRAQAPLHLTLPPAPTQTGMRTETVIRVVVVVAATLGMLVGLLRFYCRRRPAGKLVTQESTHENYELSARDSTGEQRQQSLHLEQ